MHGKFIVRRFLCTSNNSAVCDSERQTFQLQQVIPLGFAGWRRNFEAPHTTKPLLLTLLQERNESYSVQSTLRGCLKEIREGKKMVESFID